MYFHNRAQAGRRLAEQLQQYKNQDAIVVALDRGGVIVAAQVAMQLHTNLLIYLIKNIYLPGEIQAIAGLSSTGTFAYNDMMSPGEIEEMSAEYHNFIEQERMRTHHDLNVLIGDEGEIRKELLRHRTVILISDGLKSGFSLTLARDFFKTVAIKRLVVATPLASVPAVDRMHLVGDEIYCLSVIDNYFETDHYYDDNTIPEMKDVKKIMRNISLNWKR